MDSSELLALGLVLIAAVVLLRKYTSKTKSKNSCCEKGCGSSNDLKK